MFSDNVLARAGTLAKYRTHLYSAAPLRKLLISHLPETFEQLTVEFQCVAASIERPGAHWFTTGKLADAVMASSAVPGLLPPVVIDGEHFLDGGLVHSIPVGRALALGATEIYVVHVGRIEQPLKPPRSLWDVCLTSFELARRHRFVEEMAELPATRPGARAAKRRGEDAVDVDALPPLQGGCQQDPAWLSGGIGILVRAAGLRVRPPPKAIRRAVIDPIWPVLAAALTLLFLLLAAAAALAAPLTRRRRLLRLSLFGAFYLASGRQPGAVLCRDLAAAPLGQP